MIAHTTPAEIRASLQELNGDDVDAILQVGTNLAAGAIAAEAERWFDKPVLAMNVITYWDALRRLGIDDRIVGSGRIFEEH
jgi:maleate isomerase